MSSRPFIGRARELEVLEDLYESGDPELFVLYGRRRVGKSELLQRFCEGRRAVYFLAAQVREKDNLRAFRDALRASSEGAPASASSSRCRPPRRCASTPAGRSSSAS